MCFDPKPTAPVKSLKRVILVNDQASLVLGKENHDYTIVGVEKDGNILRATKNRLCLGTKLTRRDNFAPEETFTLRKDGNYFLKGKDMGKSYKLTLKN